MRLLELDLREQKGCRPSTSIFVKEQLRVVLTHHPVEGLQANRRLADNVCLPLRRSYNGHPVRVEFRPLPLKPPKLVLRPPLEHTVSASHRNTLELNNEGLGVRGVLKLDLQLVQRIRRLCLPGHRL